jgi:methenyltetrahydromethanopterin cyclohydrolase
VVVCFIAGDFLTGVFVAGVFLAGAFAAGVVFGGILTTTKANVEGQTSNTTTSNDGLQVTVEIKMDVPLVHR